MAWLLHIALPHEPYALKADCSIRGLPWLASGGDSAAYEMNSPVARRANYPDFLEQVECTHEVVQSLFDEMRSAGLYDKAHIVIHGDHGSRIATHNLRARKSYRPDFRPSAETMVDYFATLFAYKPAGKAVGEYRREMVSVAVASPLFSYHPL